MPTYYYNRAKNVRPDVEEAVLIAFPSHGQGRGATHRIRRSGQDNIFAEHQCTIPLGKGENVVGNPFTVRSGPFNIDSYSAVEIKYYIDLNGVEAERAILAHRNPISEDKTPQVDMKLQFNLA